MDVMVSNTLFRLFTETRFKCLLINLWSWNEGKILQFLKSFLGNDFIGQTRNVCVRIQWFQSEKLIDIIRVNWEFEIYYYHYYYYYFYYLQYHYNHHNQLKSANLMIFWHSFLSPSIGSPSSPSIVASVISRVLVL